MVTEKLYAQTVKMPIHPQITFNQNRCFLEWVTVPIGIEPTHFNIYASNDNTNFQMQAQNLLTTIDTTVYEILLSSQIPPKNFYAIVAVAEKLESTPSAIVKIPDMSIVSAIDSMFPEKPFSTKLFSNQVIYEIKDSANVINYVVKITKVPPWMSILNTDSVYGIPKFEDAKKVFFQDSESAIIGQVMDNNLNRTSPFKIFPQVSNIENSTPVLSCSDSIFYVGLPFIGEIITTDGDILFGDMNHFEVIEKPFWLYFKASKNKLKLSGIPPKNTKAQIQFKIKVTDSKGASTQKLFNAYRQEPAEAEAPKMASQVTTLEAKALSVEPNKLSSPNLPSLPHITIDQSQLEQELKIQVSQDLIGESYKMIDKMGQVVLTGKISEQEFLLNVAGIKPSVYMLYFGKRMKERVLIY